MGEATSPVAQMVKNRRPGFDPWVRKIPWRREWQPTPVDFPRKSHRQRSLVGYSSWGHNFYRGKKKKKPVYLGVCASLLKKSGGSPVTAWDRKRECPN